MARRRARHCTTYKLTQQADSSFGVEVTIPGRDLVNVAGFATRALAEAWVANAMREIASGTSTLANLHHWKAEPKFRMLFDNSPQPMWTYDPKSLQIVEVNNTAVAKYGYSRDEFAALKITDIRPAEDVPRLMALLPMESEGFRNSGEWRHKLKSGQIIDVEIASHNVELSGRNLVLVVSQDITERKRAQAALRDSEQRFRSLADNLPGVVYRQVMSPDGQFRDTYVSPNVKAMLGVDPDEFTNGRVGLVDFLHPADRERKLQALRESAVSLEPLEIEVRKIARPSGAARWWQLHATPTRLPDGSVQFDGIGLDVTDRRAMAEQLKQSMKMEAIGQLTGGIAHDFNNLLTVVLGNADQLEERRLGDAAARQMLQNIILAAQEAAELTKGLLAFARKQPLEPRAVNINEFVARLPSLLRRTLGEHIDIGLTLQPDLWSAYVDAHQVEAAILNLAINARDAMPAGGHLMIETANVTIDEEQAARYGETRPGSYVALGVTDDGSGMSPEILAQAIQPFFTTKPMGKGTGLGLSMVHGFAKQSGGHMSIYSEIGHGTTVRLYFSRAKVAAEKMPVSGSKQDQLPKGRETILVVEDNAPLRQIAVTILGSLGYTVIEAADAHEALALANRGAAFDLLFTDVVLPAGMSGPALVGQIKKQRPGLRVLYTSGYTENAIVHQGRLDEGVELLQKPYRREGLARKVREVLDKTIAKA